MLGFCGALITRQVFFTCGMFGNSPTQPPKKDSGSYLKQYFTFKSYLTFSKGIRKRKALLVTKKLELKKQFLRFSDTIVKCWLLLLMI